MEQIRLDRFISGQVPEFSRNEVKNLCRRGYVTVDGVQAKNSEIKIDPEKAVVAVNGRVIQFKKHLYIMLNKPEGTVCATRDGLSKTVIELLPKELRRQGLFPAGRLDKDTEGFVLITDDGELAHRMLAPKSHVPKLYQVVLEKPLCPDAERAFSDGITLEDGTKCLPAQLERRSDTVCLVTLHEGMFHQVKRMFEALDNRVAHLKRIKIGGVMLDESLAPGEVRELAAEEIKNLVIPE